MFKVGSQLFTAEGPQAIAKLARLGPGIFLDLKFHDIPSTVAGAVASASKLPGISLMTLHATGGAEMMRAASQTLRGSWRGRTSRPKLLAVTILTSLGPQAMRRVGIMGSAQERAVRLAKLAQRSGLDGAVASANEVESIRRACGRNFLIVVPGVRPSWAGRDDQARVATPTEAIRAGADYIVVGRPITLAPDPAAAAVAVLEEISQARSAV